MPTDPDVLALRAEIDTLDRALLEAIAKRRGVARKLGAAKARLELPALDPRREAELEASWGAHAGELGLEPELASELLGLVLRVSREAVAAAREAEARRLLANAQPRPSDEAVRRSGDEER